MRGRRRRGGRGATGGRKAVKETEGKGKRERKGEDIAAATSHILRGATMQRSPAIPATAAEADNKTRQDSSR